MFFPVITEDSSRNWVEPPSKFHKKQHGRIGGSSGKKKPSEFASLTCVHGMIVLILNIKSISFYTAHVIEFSRIGTSIITRFCGTVKVGKKAWTYGSGPSNVEKRRKQPCKKEITGVIRETMSSESCCASTSTSSCHTSTSSTSFGNQFRHNRRSCSSGCSTFSFAFLWTHWRFSETNKLR